MLEAENEELKRSLEPVMDAASADPVRDIASQRKLGVPTVATRYQGD